MGRKKRGPYQKKSGGTYYCRLVVPTSLRDAAGRRQLTRSLQTDDHNTAIRRYGGVLQELEKELQRLLSEPSLRQKIAQNSAPAFTPDGIDLSPTEKAAILLGVRSYDERNIRHLQVLNAITGQEPLPVSWDEALALWIKERNKANARNLAEGSIKQAQKSVEEIRSFGSPSELNKHVIRDFIAALEEKISSSTVRSRLSLLSAICQDLVAQDYLQRNPFLDVPYTARSKQERRAFTDQEITLLKDHEHPCYWQLMTGIRTGEHVHCQIEDGCLIVVPQTKRGVITWRPKTLSSHRRVPLPNGFTKPTYKEQRIRQTFRELITDPLAPVHSSRHTFYELSRRAGCDARIIEELAGHGSTTGSRSAKGYGTFPDDVLQREAKKVWDLIEDITGALN